MPRPLTAAIENESRKSRLRVVDLVRAKFPAPIGLQYWSNVRWIWDGNTYIPRINSIGSWSRTMNPETEDLGLTLSNVDGEMTRINNACEVELAEVTLIRLYPDISESIDPLWTGFGGTMSMGETTCDWGIHFGFRGFSQKGLRKISQNCWKKFADGKYCPYTGSGIGTASNLSAGIGTGDVTIGVNNPEMYIPGDVVKIDSEELLILDTSFAVIRGYNKSVITGHASGTAVFHNSCQKSADDCDRRGMNGPPIPGAEFRYFGGWDIRSPISFRQRAAKSSKPKYFTQSSMGNNSIQGETIPVVYGNQRIRDVQAAASVDAREFRHAIFIVCEGEVGGISGNLVRMNGLPPDDIDNPGKGGFDARAADSFIVWFGGIGQRKAKGAMSNQEIDTYDANPFLFNDENGGGPSLSDVCALRLRIEEGGEEFSNEVPTLDISLNGRILRTVDSYVYGDEGTTSLPNPIEVACDYLVNGKFGARLAESKIDWTEAQIQSWYCQEVINTTDQSFSEVPGVVVMGPTHEDVAPSGTDNWVLVDFGAIRFADGAMTGRTLKITSLGISGIIMHNFALDRLDFQNDNRLSRLGIHTNRDLGSIHQLIEVKDDFDSGSMPAAGDGVQVTGYHGADTIPRYRFDGVLHDDDGVEAQLSHILDNCNGYYFARGGKITFGIRKAVDLSAVNALPVLTDHGSGRNIIRESGVSSLQIKKQSAMDALANQVEVIFEDAENGFQETTIYIYDERLQLRLGEIEVDDYTRIINTKQMRLIGTATKDQAMRLGALKLREENLRRDTCTFTMSLKDSLLLEPGDVRKLDSQQVGNDPAKQLSKRMPYIRIIKIEESDKFTASIEAHRHENGVYDDTATNLVTGIDDSGTENPANFPRNVIPEPLVETIEYAKDGSTLSIVNVEVTYPSLPDSELVGRRSGIFKV